MTDHKQLLIGQAVTKTHFIGENDEYPPEGFYHDSSKTEALQQPLEDPAVISHFKQTFGLRRKDEPGLSIVVPYRFDTLNATEVLRSVGIDAELKPAGLASAPE